MTNFVDLQEGPGVKDFGCGGHSYDGHTGIDSIIRSFREVKIGVPVFAALDGRVLSVQQGVGGDFNWGPTVSNFDNHVILDHGGEQQSVYGHLAGRSITVKKGQWVAAGTQIGLTASSGNSSWPHLHFTVRQSFAPYEPFAGACGTTAGWVRQPAIPEDAWVADVALSAKAFSGKADLPYDEAVRTGTFVRGVRFVNVRVEVRNVAAAGAGRLTIRRPDGTVAYAGALTASGSRAGWAKRRLKLSLAQLGRWRLEYELGGKVAAEAPFDVVASQQHVVNRAPNAVTASLEPASPRARRGRRLPGRDLARDRGSRLRDRPLPLHVALRRPARPPGHERGALGRAPEQRRTAGRDAHVCRDSVGREAPRPDGVGQRDRCRVRERSPTSAGLRLSEVARRRAPVLVRAVLVAGEPGIPVLRLRGLGLGRWSLRRRLRSR